MAVTPGSVSTPASCPPRRISDGVCLGTTVSDTHAVSAGTAGSTFLSSPFPDEDRVEERIDSRVVRQRQHSLKAEGGGALKFPSPLATRKAEESGQSGLMHSLRLHGQSAFSEITRPVSGVDRVITGSTPIAGVPHLSMGDSSSAHHTTSSGVSRAESAGGSSDITAGLGFHRPPSLLSEVSPSFSSSTVEKSVIANPFRGSLPMGCTSATDGRVSGGESENRLQYFSSKLSPTSRTPALRALLGVASELFPVYVARSNNKERRRVQEIMSLLGLMSAAHAVVTLGLLHMRALQRWFARQRVDPVRHRRRMLIIPYTLAGDLDYWRNPAVLERGVPLGRVSAMTQVFTDASLTGWGGVCQGQAVGGVWPRSQRHINLLELETVQLVLTHFAPRLRGRDVLIRRPGSSGGAMVSGNDSIVGGGAVATSPSRGRSVPGSGNYRARACDIGTSEGLAPERDRLTKRGLSADVIRTIQSARASSTSTLYSNRWSMFVRWCETNTMDPVCCPVEQILSFLQYLLDKRRSASTIQGYAAAISACHEGFGNKTVFSHSLVKRFLTGTRRLRPVARASVPQWDLSTVLNALCAPPFEPLSQISLRLLSLKTALLLALCSTKRRWSRGEVALFVPGACGCMLRGTHKDT
ncbi:hypothetical protein DPEC_G00177610 [Dallia pectoralis]|uniref:Uncharacterized protein n=1 Tax=Dallia pectoralis TaxID=75939 RepID=A0ACC2GES4_DALPE|nr:hypothetical protein DPEC_G00177610 [Dallia pectoralis]